MSRWEESHSSTELGPERQPSSRTQRGLRRRCVRSSGDDGARSPAWGSPPASTRRATRTFEGNRAIRGLERHAHSDFFLLAFGRIPNRREGRLRTSAPAVAKRDGRDGTSLGIAPRMQSQLPSTSTLRRKGGGGTFGDRPDERLTVGLNWYLNRWVWAMLNFEHAIWDRSLPLGGASGVRLRTQDALGIRTTVMW